MIEQVIYKESIFYNDYKGDADTIQSHIEHILTFDKGRQLSNEGGYQSNSITFGFSNLIKFAVDGFATIGLKAQLNTFWLNINSGNDFNRVHIHGLEEWSVIYYHKVCCDKATTNFSHLVPAMITEDFNFVPVERRMVFFRGLMPHSVSPCGGKDHQRITLAFNFQAIAS
jgi:hypothetical protein